MRIKGLKVLVGADPELFVTDSKGNLISAVGLVPGTKQSPFPVELGAVQLDGMAAEFNIDPAKNKREFVRNLNKVMKQLDIIIGRGNTLSAVPTAHFGAEMIAAQPKEAQELGCEPDYNAYTGRENPRPNADTPFRTGSGHVHIGWTNVEDPHSPNHMQDCRTLAIYLDTFLALPSMLYDTDDERRTLYGAAGAFRPKPYGMEYRTLSNAWLRSPELMAWVYEQVGHAFRAALDGSNFCRDVDWYLKNRSYFMSPDDFKTSMFGLLDKYGVSRPPVMAV